MNREVDNIVNHIVEVGKNDIYAKTYEEGLEKGARLTIAYCMKHSYITKEFIDKLKS